MPKSKHSSHPVDAPHIVPDSTTEMIQYIGFKELGEDERDAVEEIATKYHDKVKRLIHNVANLTLHVKTHGDVKGADKQRKYTVHLKLIAPTHMFESEDASFDLRKVTHLVFEHMLNQLEHKFHHNEGVASKMLSPTQARKVSGKDD